MCRNSVPFHIVEENVFSGRIRRLNRFFIVIKAEANVFEKLGAISMVQTDFFIYLFCYLSLPLE